MWSLFSANYTSIKWFKTTVTQKLYPPAHNSACWHANLTLSSPRSIQGKGYLTHASAREVTPWPRGLATVKKKKKKSCIAKYSFVRPPLSGWVRASVNYFHSVIFISISLSTCNWKFSLLFLTPEVWHHNPNSLQEPLKIF